MKQYITRKGTFDSGHRVMNERMKCFNLHGHTYLYELCFSFESITEIGYNIDFKEIKRVGVQWIEDMLDHGMIVNPHDEVVIKAALATKSKLWYMSLNGPGQYCNPSVENIAKELFLAMEALFKSYPGLKVHQITLHETSNCYTVCDENSISDAERVNFTRFNAEHLSGYSESKGTVEYDDRKF